MHDDDDEPRMPDEQIGAEGEASKDVPPAAPSSDDDSPLGDSDQHSTADA